MPVLKLTVIDQPTLGLKKSKTAELHSVATLAAQIGPKLESNTHNGELTVWI
jgi:hypothetical protein